MVVPSITGFACRSGSSRRSGCTPPTAASKKGAGPRHITFHPNDKFAYLMNELDATVGVYGFDSAKGVLSELQIVTALPAGFDGKPSAARPASTSRFTTS